MRPLLVVVGLAFVATVLNADTQVLRCHWDVNETYRRNYCLGLTCYTYDDGENLYRGCNLPTAMCDWENYPCCSTEYCNGPLMSTGARVMSTLRVPLFIALIGIGVAARAI